MMGERLDRVDSSTSYTKAGAKDLAKMGKERVTKAYARQDSPCTTFVVVGSFNAVGYDIPWPFSMDAIINTMEYINIPVFSIPGLSCVYPDVS
eukprot:1175799-Prorocentrum_minimum.AAC.4